MKISFNRIAAVAAAVMVFASGAAGAEEKTLGWKDLAELSFVVTSGNSETETLGFRNTLTREWEKSLFTLKAGGIRVESTRQFAVAKVDPTNPNNPIVFNLEDETLLSAENYYLNARYDREISTRFFWFGGAGWDKNEFAGIANRYTAFAGVGNIWVDTDRIKFRTDYAATYTDQEDVVEQADVEGSFVGLRLSYAYLHKFGENTVYTSDLVVDGNGDETKDTRANMINSVAVAMSKRLAIKVALQWLYDNEPSFREIDLEFPAGTFTGVKQQVELDNLDSIFTTSLVISF